MEEKKLATMICIVCGKEIEKNYARNTIGNYCKTCAFDRALNIQIDKDYASGEMDENIIFDVEKALENNQDAGCYVGDLLNIIHRLQDENEGLKSVNRWLLDRCKIKDGEIHEQKAEIERLSIKVWNYEQPARTPLYNNESMVNCNLVTCYNENADLKAKNAELQKQLDELKERNYWLESEHQYQCEKSYFEGVDKGRKDTAKEIITMIGGTCASMKTYLCSIIAKRYGVEVE